VVKHFIKRESNHIKEPNKTRAQTCPSLAQARRPRSSERGSLAQARARTGEQWLLRFLA